MTQLKTVCLYCIFGAAGASAGPLEDAIIATVRLSDAPNYSWTSSVVDDARTYEVEGKTERGGFTRVRMPVINSVRRKLGRGFTDADIETIFRGNVDCVLLTEAGWQRPSELREPLDPRTSQFGRVASPVGTVPGPGTFIFNTPSRAVRSRRVVESNWPYSNLQLAINHPHEELGVIVSSHVSFTVEGDTVSGTLTDLGAQLLLVCDGQEAITPVTAAGTFKLWVRDGLVARYHLKLEGILAVTTPGSRKPRQVVVQQTVTTQISNVGTTQFEVPDAARLLLTASD